MKRIICTVLVMCIVCTFSVVGFAEENVSYNEAYSWALSNGFPEAFLSKISESYLVKIYNENAFVDEIEIEIETEDSYLPRDGEITRGRIDPSKLEVWIVGAKVISNNQIQYVNTYVFYSWDSPLGVVRFEDGLIVNWDEDVFKYRDNSFSGQLMLDGAVYDTLGANALSSIEDCGIGWYFDLPYGMASSIPFSGEFSFKIEPVRTPTYNGTTRSMTMSMKYAHSTISVGGFHIGYLEGGLDFTGSFDHLANSCTVTYGDIG